MKILFTSSPHRPPAHHRGVTLLEMTIVILVLLTLISTVTFSTGAINDWQAGKKASETLRSVYVAQRTYLSDYPTTAVAALTQADLLPYLPTKATTFPTVEDLDGNQLNIKVDVSPPVVIDAGGTIYDPSGDSNDSLWDVGE